MTYTVTIPIAGHITFQIEGANSEAAAIEAAWKAGPNDGELSYELLESFSDGNSSHCPPPWAVEAEEVMEEGF